MRQEHQSWLDLREQPLATRGVKLMEPTRHRFETSDGVRPSGLESGAAAPSLMLPGWSPSAALVRAPFQVRAGVDHFAVLDPPQRFNAAPRTFISRP